MPDGTSDAATAAQAVASTVQPAAPATPQVPQGKELVDALEYKRLQERVRGMESYWKTGREVGIQDDKGFERIRNLMSAAKTAGVELDDVVAALTEKQQASRPEGFDDIMGEAGKKFLSREEWEKQRAYDRALSEHSFSERAEQAALQKAISELLGDKPSDWDKRSVAAFLDSKRGLYPESHPLSKERFRPFDDTSLTEVLAELKKERERVSGEALKSEGERALSKAKGTPAGSTPSSTPKIETEERKPGKPTDAEIQAHADKLSARRKGNPVSSVGA